MSGILRWIRRGRGRQVPRPFAQKAVKPGEPFSLGGHIFRVIGNSTYEHDTLVRKVMREIGLLDTGMKAGETPDQYARRLMLDLTGSGRMPEIFGLLLIPDGTESERWSSALGEETAAFVGALSDPADKALLDNMAWSFLTDFFERGLGSWRNSTSSSEPAPAKTASVTSSPTTNATANGDG